MSNFMLALEITIVATSLPTIVQKLNIGADYVWITNGAALTSTAVSPLLGQLADLFGRRWLAAGVVLVFTVGGVISGAANSGTQLIIGRAIQGAGGGGISLMSSIIVSDLIPLRDRGNYIAIILTVYLVGASSGPLVGGTLSQASNTSWRWVFWLPVPFGALSLILLLLFLKVETKKEDGVTFWGKLRRIDYLGNLLIIGSTISILYALTYGGSKYVWTSPRIIGPLAVGVVGLISFAAAEGLCAGTSIMPEPVMPLRLITHRTGAIVATNAFLSALLNNWASFFLPVYFQAVQQSSPARSGVQILPMILIAVPSSIVAVTLVSKFGKYKILHICGFAGTAVGLGLFSILSRNSADVAWVMMEIVFSSGIGMVINTLLPAFQAGVNESDQAAATSTFSFLRGLANIWSMTVPAAIFNNRFESLSWRISDENVRSALSGGRAYEHATQAFLSSIQEPERSATIDVFTEALKMVWYIAAIFAGIAFILALFEKDIPLRTKLETDYGLKEEKVKQNSGSSISESSGAV
ncbi:efflux pump FUS6 [Colletotrichum liriopes]|uniref:Efflux pump FUS6 n=1 Tax=Colletotrichum liriopes TaxID=708192 RepID=A0AA37GC52_9PEZI|nr:efflux pump FUS6 [Colletotrichum liriopes]